MISLLFLVIISPFAADRCDCIEVNNYHDANGNICFVQNILWGWNDQHARYEVRSWHIVNKPERLPYRCGDEFEIRYYDDHNRRAIRSGLIKHTWTQIDPERANKALVPEQERIAMPRDRIQTSADNSSDFSQPYTVVVGPDGGN